MNNVIKASFDGTLVGVILLTLAGVCGETTGAMAVVTRGGGGVELQADPIFRLGVKRTGQNFIFYFFGLTKKPKIENFW